MWHSQKMGHDRTKLINAAQRLLRCRPDAEDALQDTYVRAFDTFSDWRVPEPAWMSTVLRHIAIDRYRRRRTELKHAAGTVLPVNPADSAWLTYSEREAALHALLSRVTASEAAALLLRDVFDLEYAEIANLLDKNEPATRQLLHRARQRARTVEDGAEVDAAYLRLCCRAIETCQPALLVHMLRGITTEARAYCALVGRQDTARGSSKLVQFNGQYAIALVLDGVVLCIVPVGVPTLRSGEVSASI